ncbi:hypothetical protein BU16DRAFT_523636 [Lophium mytilinum]|uniref:DUF3533 domain-containing protein n=1 Tax=Lophium mytilinum TaxID=390894 RepID=A0A6A6R506_9PEZI|nr:hypothetical protein BU16DRAFT_523636 [Lophium mytilinum]
MSLGCQIAPAYREDAVVYSSSSSSSSSSDEEDQRLSSTEEEEARIEKVETAVDDGGVSRRPTHTRTKSSRSAQPPLAPVGFWHYEMSGVRLHVIKLWARTTLILAIAIMAFLCLFWGALFRQNNLAKKLSIYVVDFDGQVEPYLTDKPFVGPLVTKAVQTLLDSGGVHPGYIFKTPSDFDNDPMKVRAAVFDQHAWAAVIINPNATTLLYRAIEQGNTSYSPNGAGQIVYNTARDQNVAGSYITPSTTALQTLVAASFGRTFLSTLLTNSSNTLASISRVPQAISPGIALQRYDLRPFGPPIATPAVSVGLIYLIIIAFFSFTFFLPIHLKYLQPKGHPPLHFHQLIIWRWTATVGSYFFLSCVYSLVSLAYLMPMSNHPASHVQPAVNANPYGKGTFMVYWMINWIAMIAFGIACENMAMMLGTPWTALWLIFWVISNVATGFYSLALAPSFYRWGYAWPMHNVVEATRSTLFDLHPRIGLNVGILLAWCAVDTALFPLCCYYMRWKSTKEKKLATQREANWQEKMRKEKEEPSLFTRVTTTKSRPME